MNTNHLKKFAQEARRKLLAQVGAKLTFVLTGDTAELREKAPQIKSLKDEIARTGKAQLIDKVAYTWFNRLMALRFLDANDYQPSGIRIVSPREGYTLPQLLDEAKQGHFPEDIPVNQQKVLDLLDGRLPSSNPQNEAYRYLLIAACNALHRQFPFLFEKINDYTELLLPDDLTSEFSIVHDVVEGMPAEDCEQVEIIGWLYQFYISEKKDAVFASKSKVKKEDIPAATQLFTPRWIVEYMVQNTLGKLWLQNRPKSRLREHMPYFIESASQQAEDYLRVGSPEDIKLLDQACGSGHILVYAFELLTKIYEEEGYNPGDIPVHIIEKNLYGFEIDERAAQLAGFSLLMKARGYYRRLFRKEALVPNILQFQDVTFSDEELDNYFRHLKLDMFNQDLKADIRLFEQATNYGSLMQISTREIPTLKRDLPSPDIFMLETHHKLRSVLRQMELLSMKFHCVVDNPPYMGSGNMNNTLSDYVKTHYPESKADLMACFMEAGWKALLPNGYLGMINQHSWMFLSSYEKLRETLIEGIFFDTLLHLGPRTFPEIGGEVVQNAAFTFWNKKPAGKGTYLRLVDEGSSEGKRTKTLEAIQNPDCGWRYTANQKDFEKIPGSSIGYWLSENLKSAFEFEPLNSIGNSKRGLQPGNTPKIVRKWTEVSFDRIEFTSLNRETAVESFKKWFKFDTGGPYRKWYGNLDSIVNWENDGFEIKNANNPIVPSEHLYFTGGIVWSMVATSNPAFRIHEPGMIAGNASPCLYGDYDPNELIGFLNSSVCRSLLRVIAPTLNILTSDVDKIPYKAIRIDFKIIAEECINISRNEWNSNESSWDFSQSELLRLRGQDLEESYDLYCQYWKNKFHQLHRNEEELNRQFIDIYGLQDELTPDVPLEDITILKEETRIEQGQLVFDAGEVMAQFVSYAVGCMMGRYSLDKPGLVLANQGETLADYVRKVLGDSELAISEEQLTANPKGASSQSLTANNQQLIANLSFVPDDDAIIPILDDEWFEDDIVGRFHAFLKASFGERDFRRNLAFLEAQLGKDIRKYFVRDFYNDHIKRYKKRPIYWLFTSPKGSFSALVYLHRYTPDTLNNLLNHYLREFIQKLKAQKQHYQQIQISGSPAEQTHAIKRIDQLDKMLLDCEQYERDILYPLATERFALDLDDGVLVNYNKLGQAVKEVSGLNDGKAKEKVRGFEWVDGGAIRY